MNVKDPLGLTEFSEKNFIFLGGMHRSGTSLLHRILSNHPAISGIRDSNAPEDEGQHLQTVYKPAIHHGGPGRFALDKTSHLTEVSKLITPENRYTLAKEWMPYFDLSKPFLIEKSPPNIVRMRFLQALFPNSRFLVILRHPVVVALATSKWNGLSIRTQVRNCLAAYDIALNDSRKLNNVMWVRYEDIVEQGEDQLKDIFEFLELDYQKSDLKFEKGVNQKYQERWSKERETVIGRIKALIGPLMVRRLSKWGYSIDDFSSVNKGSELSNEVREFLS